MKFVDVEKTFREMEAPWSTLQPDPIGICWLPGHVTRGRKLSRSIESPLSNSSTQIYLSKSRPNPRRVPSHPIPKIPPQNPQSKQKRYPQTPRNKAAKSPIPSHPSPPHQTVLHTSTSKTAKHHPPAPLPSPNRLFNQHTYLPCEYPHPAPTHPPVPAQSSIHSPIVSASLLNKS